MGVFNCATTLRPAIESILCQSYTDWEFIICDDMSTDATLSILEGYANCDTRIVVIKNKQNLGLNHSLNRCLSVAQGEFYARMDGDDISTPNRLEKLVAAMDANPNVAVVSSWMTCFDESGDWGVVKTKTSPGSIDFIHGSPFCHAPCIMRTKVLKALGGYGTERWLKRSQDYHLWFRLYAAGYHGMNMPEALYRVRDNREATMRRNMRNRLIEARIMLMGFRLLHLPLWTYLYIARPVLLGLMPVCLYGFLRRWRRRN